MTNYIHILSFKDVVVALYTKKKNKKRRSSDLEDQQDIIIKS